MGVALKFINTMYLLVSIMACCLSPGEGSVCMSLKPRVVKVMMGRQERARPSVTAFFFVTLPVLQPDSLAQKSIQCLKSIWPILVEKLLTLKTNVKVERHCDHSCG